MTVVRWQILKLTVEVLQKWEVGWNSPYREWERTKYVPELKLTLVYKSVYFSATTD